MALTAACGKSTDTHRAGATTAAGGTATSPSPSVDVTASTKAVCDKAGGVVTEETGTALGNQIGFMIVARQQHDTTGEARARAAVKAQADAWARQLRVLKAETVDPALRAALETAARGLERFGTDEYLVTINSTADASRVDSDMVAAGADLGRICG